MFNFEKFSSASFYVAPSVEKVIEFSPQGIDIENILKVLSLSATVKCENAEAYVGYAEIKGRANFRLIYIDKENALKGVDYNADFTARVDGEFLEEDNLCCDINVAEAEVGANDNLTLTAIVEITVSATRRQELSLLTTLNDCYVGKKDMLIPAFITSKLSTSEFFDDASVGGEIDNVLAVSADVFIVDAKATDGGADLKSKVAATVTYVMEGKLAEQNFEIPLEDEVSLDGVVEGDILKVAASIKNVKVVLQGVTGDNVLRIEGEAIFKIQAFRCQNIETIDDAFMLSNELVVSRNNYHARCLLQSEYLDEAVSGVALLADNRPPAMQVVALPYARCYTAKTYVNDEGEIVAEGVVNTDIIYTDENGYNSVRAEIPFTLALGKADDGIVYSAKCIANAVTAKVRREREFEIDINLAVCLTKCLDVENDYISDIELGEERPKNNSALSMYIAGEGEAMLDVCKALYAMPDEILAQNPNLTFPLTEGDEIVYFRELK